ncbi:cation:proton antiporter [Paraglaciecola aquimarina]|uniref:Cation:proton antiporter n=1 Tax=Paraglaciecola aquimarina TaxID=1235557 RepID=A0ABU3SYN4_9ALTE|nr:cation:proton antiporter [Paraglaciecola aquimarina]MDU0355101.1 cation:proton antiporter [Paraglaciecola aquimarina]
MKPIAFYRKNITISLRLAYKFVYMEFAFILLAFIFGLGLKLLKLPTLIGYLLAGFAAQHFGFSTSDNLQNIANLGITLMLFTIGLKLNVRDLYKKEVWVGSVSHYSLLGDTR